VVAAIVSSWVNTALARRATRLEERARVRSTLAEAFQAYADYKEFPYAIRRRRGDQLSEERVRLSEEVRRVQSRLSYYEAWTLAESPETVAAYNELTKQLRRVAGASTREAWKGPALDNDEGTNIGLDRVDLRELKEAEQTFLRAAETHVAALTAPWWRGALNKLHGKTHPGGHAGGPIGEPPLPVPRHLMPPGRTFGAASCTPAPAEQGARRGRGRPSFTEAGAGEDLRGMARDMSQVCREVREDVWLREPRDRCW
jgi:hypothetical protein